METGIRRYIGDRVFYRRVMTIAVPIMIQNGITNLASLLDGIMVGQMGTEPMSAVAIVNQLNFIYILCIFGALSGAGIFTAQYFGKGDLDGVRYTFRFKLIIGVILTALTIIIFLVWGKDLVLLYLAGEADGTDAAAALTHAMSYLIIILFAHPAFIAAQVYASTLRECGETMVPMKAGITGVLVNLCLNWVLIFGHFGLPAMGVAGAGLATVISRYVEAGIIVVWAHRHTKEMPFMQGLYSTLKIPADVVKRISVKGAPLLFNETLWSAAMATLLQCYSVRGLNVVAGMNISNTISNLFNIAFMSMGSAVAIMVGQQLGASQMEEARSTARKLIAFSVFISVIIGAVMFFTAPLFPAFYNTNDTSKTLASSFLRVSACFMPQMAFLHASYFTLRSGGRTIITFFFDSVFVWAVSVPVAYVLAHFTAIPVVSVFILVTACEFIKTVIGYILVKKGVWVNNIVDA